MDNIVGIVYEHGNDDWSIWITDYISAKDQAAIRKILEKYDNDGGSVRGMEVKESIEKIMEG